MREIRVLIVDDNADHRFLTAFAFRKVSPGITVSIVELEDGVQALDYVFARGRYPDRQLPDFVLLDLSLPRADGFEVLHKLKRDPDLVHIPVIMLTSSDRPDDVRQAYAHGANSFVTKRGDLGPLVRYWTETVTFSAVP